MNKNERILSLNTLWVLSVCVKYYYLCTCRAMRSLFECGVLGVVCFLQGFTTTSYQTNGIGSTLSFC